MTHVNLEHEDHKKILSALDCSQAVAALDKDVSLLHLMIKEMKSDKEKANRTLMWVCGMAFTIIMAVAGFGIQSNATIQVLQEKVSEQKNEISRVQDAYSSLYDEFNRALESHNH